MGESLQSLILEYRIWQLFLPSLQKLLEVRINPSLSIQEHNESDNVRQ